MLELDDTDIFCKEEKCSNFNFTEIRKTYVSLMTFLLVFDSTFQLWSKHVLTYIKFIKFCEKHFRRYK